MKATGFRPLVLGLFTAALSLLLCPPARAGDPAGEIQDPSAFTHFSFWREGLCPPLDEVYSAEITVNPQGEHILAMSFLELGDGFPPEADCLVDVVVPVFDACAAKRVLPERILAPHEVAALTEVFSEVEISDGPDPACAFTGVSCLYDHLAWDSTEAWFCGPAHVSSEHALSVLRLLERLRAGSRDCNQNGVLDAEDVETAAFQDLDADGILDVCESFLRGDSNVDGAVNISDAVNLLDWLFRGQGSVEACLDAADFNDDGAVDISDPVATLMFLFVGAGALAEGCAIDRTEDGLTCNWHPCD